MLRLLRAPWPVASIALFCGLAMTLSCGRKHGLGVEPTSSATSSSGTTTSGTGGNGGGGGTTGNSVGSTGGSGGATSTGSGGESTGGAGGGEPPGPTQLTIVNGVNDYEAIKICFLPFPANNTSVMPWPSEAQGLPFARAVVVKPIDETIAANVDVRPHIIAGDLTQITGKTCAEVLAIGALNPSPIVVFPMAVLPAQVFTSDKSLLLAPIGCLGGPGHDGPNAVLACGPGYTPATPTATLVALGMSRKNDPFYMSFQVVNASTALQPSDMALRPGFDGSTVVLLATKVSTGEIAPKPPDMGITLANLGELDKVKVETFLPQQQQMFMTSTTPLTEAFANGTVPMIDFDDGAGLVLIAVGSYPGVVPGGIWHKLTFTMVKADP